MCCATGTNAESAGVIPAHTILSEMKQSDINTHIFSLIYVAGQSRSVEGSIVLASLTCDPFPPLHTNRARWAAGVVRVGLKTTAMSGLKTCRCLKTQQNQLRASGYIIIARRWRLLIQGRHHAYFLLLPMKLLATLLSL